MSEVKDKPQVEARPRKRRWWKKLLLTLLLLSCGYVLGFASALGVVRSRLLEIAQHPERVPERTVRFLDRHLKGLDGGTDAAPRVSLFVLGEDRWRREDDWPPPGVEPGRLHLDGDGVLRPDPPDGAPAPSTLVSARPPEMRSTVEKSWKTRTGSSELSTVTALVRRIPRVRAAAAARMTAGVDTT